MAELQDAEAGPSASLGMTVALRMFRSRSLGCARDDSGFEDVQKQVPRLRSG